MQIYRSVFLFTFQTKNSRRSVRYFARTLSDAFAHEKRHEINTARSINLSQIKSVKNHLKNRKTKTSCKRILNLEVHFVSIGNEAKRERRIDYSVIDCLIASPAIFFYSNFYYLFSRCSNFIGCFNFEWWVVKHMHV